MNNVWEENPRGILQNREGAANDMYKRKVDGE